MQNALLKLSQCWLGPALPLGRPPPPRGTHHLCPADCKSKVGKFMPLGRGVREHLCAAVGLFVPKSICGLLQTQAVKLAAQEKGECCWDLE